MKQTFSVTGMNCQHCVQRVSEALAKVPGVTAVNVTLVPPQATIESTAEIAPSLLDRATSKAGDFHVSESR
jgi:copper chaperone CopZ